MFFVFSISGGVVPVGLIGIPDDFLKNVHHSFEESVSHTIFDERKIAFELFCSPIVVRYNSFFSRF